MCGKSNTEQKIVPFVEGEKVKIITSHFERLFQKEGVIKAIDERNRYPLEVYVPGESTSDADTWPMSVDEVEAA